MLPIPAAHHLAGSTIPVGGKYVLSGAYPFYNVYETSDGGFMTLGALEPKFWANFCRKVGREDLVARQFDSAERRENLFDEVRAVFKSRTRSEWVELMLDADCCCEPVLSMSEAFQHSQTLAREMVRESEGSTIRQLGFAYKMSETPPREVSSAPELGEHTDELLTALGLSDEERARLRQGGVIL
jgi:crotonobetainyl-CoA:carnitine CoA-transferase CaiB-like acyl-CoA transferase